MEEGVSSMAKLSSVSNTKPIALSFPGVFIRNLPAKVIDIKFGNISKDIEEDQEAVIVMVFNDLLCDEAGAGFEDCGSFDEITSSLSVSDIHSIMNAIPEALAPNGSTEGK
jgi:hypothetical protein